MTTIESELIGKSLDTPEQTEAMPKRTGGYVSVAGVTIGRGALEPGWRWSEHVKPLAGTESCQARHIHYLISGRLGVRMNSGAEQEFGPGDAFFIAPGHDAWVVGDEPAVMIDFSGLQNAPA